MARKPAAFWTRLLKTLKPGSSSDSTAHDLPQVGDDGLLVESAEMSELDEAEPVAGKTPSAMTRRSKRDQTIAQLREGYKRATQVIEEIRTHLVRQGEQTERICTSLEQLARSMTDVPNVSRQQAQTLEAIAGQLETTNVRTQQLTEVMNEIPKVTQSQTKTLVGINRQLEMVGEQNVVANQKMENLGTTINTLGESNNTQSEAIREMNAKAAEQNELLTQVIAKQSKRFTMLFVVTVILAAAVVATAIVGIVIRQ